jgi:hypothetical protein
MNSPLSRLLNDYPPDWPEAVVTLIDALREYIRCNKDIDDDARLEGWDISPDQWRRQHLHMQAVTSLLKELETYEMDDTLCGVVKK